VLLLDEYRTSSSCPGCFATTTYCVKRPHPRPWRRKLAAVWVHGLAKCDSMQCKSECGGRTKKWNRDGLTISHFRRIYHAYIHGRGRPDDLRSRRRENGDGNAEGNAAEGNRNG
jgi:hypothetical protein